MNKIILFIFLILNTISYSEIKITAKPIVFKEIRAQNNGIYKSKAKARGIILIVSDNLKEDAGKLVKFEVPDYLIMSNGKNYIKADKIVFRDKDQEVIITQETEKVIYHVILDKKELSKEREQSVVEGSYTGNLPINYSIYSKEE